MKTPREILLEKHGGAEPKLDAISRRIAAQIAGGQARERSWPTSFFVEFCREIVLPARRVWIGLAAAWVVILAADLDFRAGAPRNAAPISPDAAALLFDSSEPEFWMAESPRLPVQPKPAPSKQSPPQPRAEYDEPIRLI